MYTKIRMYPYRERYTTGSSTCSTIELPVTMTIIVSAVKEGLQPICDKVYLRGNINQM